MITRFAPAISALFLVGALPLRADPPPLRSIFDAQTLAGWQGNPQIWRVEDGAVTGGIRSGDTLASDEFIYWEGELHDFALELEFRISGDASANSGIQFRSQRLDTGASHVGFRCVSDAPPPGR